MVAVLLAMRQLGKNNTPLRLFSRLSLRDAMHANRKWRFSFRSPQARPIFQLVIQITAFCREGPSERRIEEVELPNCQQLGNWLLTIFAEQVIDRFGQQLFDPTLLHC